MSGSADASGLPPLLRLLYRGALKSCNYACDYCPFAKARETRAEMEHDRQQLERFVAWATDYPGKLGVLFTPWGEALVRPWYRQALVTLSHLPQVERVAIQTNLAAPLDFVAEADREALALWATFHPTQVSRERFVARCRELDALGARYSVGVVGLREHFAELRALSERFPDKPLIVLLDVAYLAYAPDPFLVQKVLCEIEPFAPNLLLLFACSVSKSHTKYGMRTGALVARSPATEIRVRR